MTAGLIPCTISTPQPLITFDKPKTVKKKDEKTFKKNWHEAVRLPVKIEQNCTASLKMITKFNSQLDEQPRYKSISEHCIELTNDEMLQAY